MNQYALDMYRQMFLTLRRGQANGMPSKAKPIFILSVIEAIPQYNQNVFNVNDSFLVVRYKTNLELYTNKQYFGYFLVAPRSRVFNPLKI